MAEKQKSSTITFGILIIYIGVLTLLQNTGVKIFGYEAWNFWPVFIIFLGFMQIISKMSFWGALITISIGLFLQLSVLEKLPEDVWKYFWPILLIIIGLKIIFSREKNNQASSLNSINSFAIFGGSEVKSDSNDFQGGEAIAICGGINIDLRNARLLNDSAVLTITAVAGGVEVYVPNDWKINVKGFPILGGWDNKTSQVITDQSKTLTINATVVMGGLDIKNNK